VERAEVASALEARHISKSFGGTRALDDAELIVSRREIHGLLGENGSGKSTLIKILAGYHAPDPGGSLVIGDRAARLPLRPGEARELGLRFVHQDLSLIPSLSVVENLQLEELAGARRRHISWQHERRKASDTFARFGVELDPRMAVHDLRPAERAQLATMRALAGTPGAGEDPRTPDGMLVFDETTAYLSGPERDRFLALVRAIAAEGVSVLFVSHDLGEVRAISDRVTVLRDGRNAGTVATDSVRTRELVELVIGHRLAPLEARRHEMDRLGGAHAISVTGLDGDTVHDVSIELMPGEVVGLTGVPGSGFEEIPYLLFGARRPRAGWLTLDRGHDLTAMNPHRALRAGIALLPGDRQREGTVASLSVEANVTLPILDRYVHRFRLRRGQLLSDTTRLLSDYRVRPGEPGLAIDALSGGNQQKALLAKWLQLEPALLLLHEPTRGVDVSVRQEIAGRLRELAAAGVAILCASSDHEELAVVCDRVLIFSDGELLRELIGDDVTRERIATHCHDGARARAGGAVPSAGSTK
jgi:ribose transport system ATP-binding protein